MYSIFYYNMINIRVLLIIRVLIILKHFEDLDFECYIYIYVCVCVYRERGNLKKNGDLCVERERGRQFFKKRNGDMSTVYIYIKREREREREIKKKKL
jgi:hypothetical protein